MASVGFSFGGGIMFPPSVRTVHPRSAHTRPISPRFSEKILQNLVFERDSNEPDYRRSEKFFEFVPPKTAYYTGRQRKRIWVADSQYGVTRGRG